jgi:hypothetical protein
MLGLQDITSSLDSLMLLLIVQRGMVHPLAHPQFEPH